MPAACGLPPLLSAGALREFRVEQLWLGPRTEQAVALWRRLQARVQQSGEGTTELRRRLLRLQLAGSLLEALTEQEVTPESLLRASQTLRLLEDGREPRSAEAHFLLMLQRDLPGPPPPAALLREALLVRQLAERAALGRNAPDPGAGPDGIWRHPYSEWIYSQVGKEVAQADQARRRGEDLLFAADRAAWDEAGQHLAEARRLYTAALAAAGQLQQALATRDLVLADLPWYTRWLARQRRVDDRQSARVEGLLLKAEQLWADVYQLANHLEKPRANPGQPEEVPAGAVRPAAVPLARQTAAIRQTFAAIQDDFNAQCRRLQRDARLPQAQQQIEDLLTVPLIQPRLRLDLLRNSREISLRLNQTVPAVPGRPGQGRGLPQASAEQIQRGALEAGRREGRLGLALLSDPWTEEWFGQEQRKTVRTLLTDPAGPSEDQLDRAGQMLGGNWYRRVQETDRHLSASYRADTLAPAASEAVVADRLGRLLDGAGAELLPSELPEPAVTRRRLSMHPLLLGQARRAMSDHWAAAELPGPSGSVPRPYYLSAATALADDALEMARTADPLLSRARQASTRSFIQNEIRESGLKLASTRPSPRVVSMDRRVSIGWSLRAEAETPPGVPVLWLKGPERLFGEAGVENRRLTAWPEKPYQLTYNILSPWLAEETRGRLARCGRHPVWPIPRPDSRQPHHAPLHRGSRHDRFSVPPNRSAQPGGARCPGRAAGHSGRRPRRLRQHGPGRQGLAAGHSLQVSPGHTGSAPGAPPVAAQDAPEHLGLWRRKRGRDGPNTDPGRARSGGVEPREPSAAGKPPG